MYQQVQSHLQFTIAYKVYSLLLHLFKLDDVIMKKMYVEIVGAFFCSLYNV